MYKNGSDVTFTSKIHSNSLITDTGLTLQWYKDTIDISTNINRLIKLKDNNKYSGSKTENLLIRNLITGDKSSYWCIVSTGCGSDTAKVMIGDNIYFKIIKETGDFTDCEGTTCKLRVRVEQYAKGTIEYQWYNPGYKKIVESEKFKGTKTRELTINNVTRKDNNAYYVLVTLKESGYSLRCDHFYVEPTYKPEIMIQPVDFIIKNRENNPTVYGQTYVGVGISNRDICSFRWFRNDTLVRVQWTMFSSNYLLGPNNSTRPAKKTDVGLYKCQISNNCGTVWSDSAWVVWGYEDVEQCEGKQAELVVDELNTETEKYYYKWYYKGKLLKESNKLSGTNTSKLTINNINEEEGGNYDVYAINALTLKEKYLGKVYLMINLSPKIAKELPDTIYKSGKYLKNSPISVKVTGSILFYQIYKENIPYGDVISKESFNIYDEYQVFYYGGSDNDLPDGNYYIKFWNECGEKNSKKFVVLHQPKPVGTNIPDDIISEVDNELYKSERGFSIFPNPTTDFITIDVKPSEGSRVEIYNVMGFLIQPTQLRKDLTPTILEDEVLSIDISNLLPGVYFVKIGNRVEKFVKL